MVLTLMLAAALAAAGATGIALWFVGRLRNVHPESADAIAGISLDKYGAFHRLMSGADLAFLESQPGYAPSIGKKLRRAHVRTARLYLHEMRVDFARLSRAARAIAARSEVDRLDLVTAVQKEQFHFYWLLVRVRVGVELFGAGIAVPALPHLEESLARIREAIAAASQPIPQF